MSKPLSIRPPRGSKLHGFVANIYNGICFVAFEDGLEGVIGARKIELSGDPVAAGDHLRCDVGEPEPDKNSLSRRRAIFEYEKLPMPEDFGVMEISKRGLVVMKCPCRFVGYARGSPDGYPIFSNRYMKTICDVNRITPPGGIHAKGDQFRDTELLVAVVRTRIPSRNGASGWIVREILACRPIRVESGSSEGNSKSSSDRTTDGESPKTASQNSIRPLILIPERDSQLQTKYPLEDEASTCSFRREPSGSGVSDRPAENRTREIEPSNSQPKPGRIAAPQTYEKQKIQSDELRDQPETSQEVRKSSRTSEKQRIRGVCVKIWGHYRVLWLKDGRLAVYDCREWPEQGERRVQLGRFYEVFVSKLDTPVLDKKLNYGWEITDCRAIPDVHQPIVDEKKANFRCRNLVFTSYRQEKNKRVPILKDEFFGEIPDRNEILADPAPGDKFHVVIRAVPKSDSGLEWIVHSDFIEEERPPMAVVPPFDQMRRNSLESTTLPYDQRSVSSSRTNDELYRINEVSSTPKDELRAASSLMENSELSFDESIQRVPEVTDKFLELADLMLK